MSNGSKHKLLMSIGIIGLYFFYSLIGIVAKYNSLTSEVGSLRFTLLLGVQLIGLATFTYGWQFLLKKFDLSFVYLFKGTTLLWGMLFARYIFLEEITFPNILGAIIIVIGMGVVLNE